MPDTPYEDEPEEDEPEEDEPNWDEPNWDEPNWDEPMYIDTSDLVFTTTVDDQGTIYHSSTPLDVGRHPGDTLEMDVPLQNTNVRDRPTPELPFRAIVHASASLQGSTDGKRWTELAIATAENPIGPEVFADYQHIMLYFRVLVHP